MLIGQQAPLVLAVVVDAVEVVQAALVTDVECLRSVVVANHLLEDAHSAKHF